MTPARACFETELLPDFARRFSSSQLVLNIGAGEHSYRDAFPCRVVTCDRRPGCDETFTAEHIPYADVSVDGVLMMGVFERLDDPIQAMRELHRILRPAGWLLLSALGLEFEWRKPCDRWRLSPGGVTHVAQGFTTAAERYIGHVHFLLLQKPTGAPS